MNEGMNEWMNESMNELMKERMLWILPDVRNGEKIAIIATDGFCNCDTAPGQTIAPALSSGFPEQRGREKVEMW